MTAILGPDMDTSKTGRVLVVLGYGERRPDGSHGISEICRAGVRRAAALAAEPGTRAVVLTGWSPDGGPSEAEQMAAIWTGPPGVPLLLEPLARNTAENAVRSLQALRASPADAAEVVVVCSIRHVPRVRYLFGDLFRRHAYAVCYRLVTRPRPSLRLLLEELSSLTRMVGDRRAAASLLDAPGGYAATTWLRSTPMPSTSTSTTEPTTR
jgi:hypothetical protein